MEFPIVEMLIRYINSSPHRLHVPGHKGRLGSLQIDELINNPLLSDFKAALGAASIYDITELSFSDNLLCPRQAIKKSQELFAKEAGVAYSHYSVNGSTAGIFAMLSVCGRVLIERSSHVSVFNAVRTLKKNTYVVNNKIVDGVSFPIGIEEIKYAIEKKKIFRGEQSEGFDAVFICGANYYGMRAEVEKIYEYLAPKGIKLFVDGAHAAHYGKGLFPPSFAGCCDAFVVSTHKTLGSLTQTAVLNVNNAEINLPLKHALNIFTTTSPSYILLASIEFSRAVYRTLINDCESLYAAYDNFVNEARRNDINILQNDDFTRLVIGIEGMSGEMLYHLMELKGIYCEFYDEKRICIVITLYDELGIYKHILNALLSVIKNYDSCVHIDSDKDNSHTTTISDIYAHEYHKKCDCNNYIISDIDIFCTTISDINQNIRCAKLVTKSLTHEVVTCAINETEGMLSAEDIYVFPPSLPVILRGEKITRFQIDALRRFDSNKIVGLKAGKIKVFPQKN